MPIGILTLHLYIPGCHSLKQKRSRLKPLLARLHREFNISTAEMDRHDSWKEAIIACALVSNNNNHTQRTLQKISKWVEKNWPDVTILGEDLEII